MYGLPQSTEIKKQLPKKAIYAKFELKPSQRESFDADIARIDIVGVISTSTIPAVSIGEEIKEFYILAVQLKRKEYNNKNIALLSRLIPQKMVIALHYQNEVQLAALSYNLKILILSGFLVRKSNDPGLFGFKINVLVLFHCISPYVIFLLLHYLLWFLADLIIH